MNKKKLVGWILGGVLSLGAIGGASAGIVVATHDHEYSLEWSTNETHHWHKATCSHEDKVSDLNEHNWGEPQTVSATCTSDGAKTVECISCGYKKVEVLPKTGHSWDGGVITEADCDSDGFTTYTCGNCGSTKNDNYIDKTGHTYFSVFDYDETSHWQVSLCEHEEVRTEAENHSFGEWSTKKPAGCLSDEILHRVCECGYEETKKGQSHKAEEHQFGIDNEYYCMACECFIVDNMSLNDVASTINDGAYDTITYLVTGESTITSGDIARGAETVNIIGDDAQAKLILTGDNYKKVEAGTSNLTIKDLIFEDARTNMASWETWNIMIKSSKLSLIDCSFNNGLLLSSQTEVLIDGCTFLKGHSGHYAVWVGQKGEFTYEDNVDKVDIIDCYFTGYRAIKTLTSGAEINIIRNVFDTIEDKPALNISSVIGDVNTIKFDKNKVLNCEKGVYECESDVLNNLIYGENLVR